MKIQRGIILYVFKHREDPWVDGVKTYFMGPLGWDPEDWELAWIDLETKMPSLFGQNMTVYRYLGLSPKEAVEEIVRHPDYQYLRPAWEAYKQEGDG
jgi:hypothetical protein